MDLAIGPNMEKGPASDVSFMVLIVPKIPILLSGHRRYGIFHAKQCLLSLFPRAKIAPYLAASPTTRKETEFFKWPKSQIPRRQQVEFLPQSQIFIFKASLTSGPPVCLPGFLHRDSSLS